MLGQSAPSTHDTSIEYQFLITSIYDHVTMMRGSLNEVNLAHSNGTSQLLDVRNKDFVVECDDVSSLSDNHIRLCLLNNNGPVGIDFCPGEFAILIGQFPKTDIAELMNLQDK